MRALERREVAGAGRPGAPAGPEAPRAGGEVAGAGREGAAAGPEGPGAGRPGSGWGPLRGAAASLGLSVLLLAWAGPAAAQGSGVGPPLGTPAIDARLEDLEGNPVQLLDHVREGTPTLLEFWATWCEQCEALQPQLDQIQAQYGDRVNVVAVAVAVNQNPRRIRRHLERHDPGYPFLYDARGEVVRAYAAPTTSVVVILDGKGRVAYTGVGVDQDLVGEVEKLLGTHPSSP